MKILKKGDPKKVKAAIKKHSHTGAKFNCTQCDCVFQLELSDANLIGLSMTDCYSCKANFYPFINCPACFHEVQLAYDLWGATTSYEYNEPAQGGAR